jgi:PKD repeat protein
VTITQGGHSASSVPYLITIDTVTAGFSLVRDTAAAHHWFVVNQCHGAGNLYYLWSWGDGGHDSSATPTHTYSSAGNYNICVEVYDRNGCNDRYCDSSTYIYRSQAIISVLVLPVAAAGINDVSAASHVRVYPNPTTGTLSIEVPAASQGSAHIFDALGRWMRDLSLSSVKTTTDVSDLPDGVYTIVVKAGSENYNVRFVKTR